MVFAQKTNPGKGAPFRCSPLEHLDRIQITFDDHRLVNNAGLLLPATLALSGAVAFRYKTRLRMNPSALAGGDCIDDADALRAGGTAGVLDCTYTGHSCAASGGATSASWTG